MLRTLLCWSMLISFIISVLLVKTAKSLPDDICNYAFNSSDCNRKPAPVFAYYKPGSRCEIEIWRGCPTLNKFDNEYICSHHCIGRLNFDDYDGVVNNNYTGNYGSDNTPQPFDGYTKGNAENIDIISVTSEEDFPIPVKEDSEYCSSFFDGRQCNPEVKTVYSFNRITCECEEAHWRGCKTKNKFDEIDSCLKVCNRDHCLATLKLKTAFSKMNITEEKDVHKLLLTITEPTLLKKVETVTDHDAGPEENAKVLTSSGEVEADTEEAAAVSTDKPAVPTTVNLPLTSEATTISPLLPDEVEVDYK